MATEMSAGHHPKVKVKDVPSLGDLADHSM
jgi:hypothetical protein